MIVLLGGNGYIGRAFQSSLSRLNIPFEVVSRRVVDYSNQDTLTAFLRERKPEFLINSAGYTGQPNVDACELHKTECLAANAVLPGLIRAACERAGIPWGHVSSGCIYTGAKSDGSGFTEQDPPNFSFRQNNCSFYSGCKALGEELLAGAQQCFVWRLRIPFDNVDSSRNYISKVLRYEKLLDVRNSLSQLDEFTRACVASWTKRVPFGVYNMTNPGSVTTRDVVELIRKHKVSKKDFQFFESEDEFMHLAAKTPRSSCVLDAGKAVAAGLKLSDVRSAVEMALREWKASS